MKYSSCMYEMRRRECEEVSKNSIDVLIRPPSLYLGGLTVGCLLDFIYPIGPGLAQGTARPVYIGLGLALIGVLIAWRAIAQFAEAGTTIQLDEPTEELVTNGLYSWSRNPIYIALTLIYVGLAIALTSGWALIVLPAVIVILRKTVIEKEEILLEKEFGTPYLAYKKKVPRWL
jgi:protein-S-isoprenylcysteine O-methyltransferase Ste14